MKKLYNFRLDCTLIKQVDQLQGSRTSVVTNALQSYLQNATTLSERVNTNYLQHLEDEVQYLRSQVNGLMFARIPLLSKIKMKLLESKN